MSTVKQSRSTKQAAVVQATGSKSNGTSGPQPVRTLKGLLTRKMREAQARKVLLFLSTGDTCRGPMAAAYFKKLLEERKIKHIEVRSAGVMTIPGLLATEESKEMLEPYGISLDKHRSQPLTEEMIRRADLILGMTPFHVQMVLRMSEDARGKTFLIKEYTGVEPKGRPIPDPMGCTLEVYKRCMRQIKQACDRLVEMEFVTGKSPRSSRGGSGRSRSNSASAASRSRTRRSRSTGETVAASDQGGSSSERVGSSGRCRSAVKQ